MATSYTSEQYKAAKKRIREGKGTDRDREIVASVEARVRAHMSNQPVDKRKSGSDQKKQRETRLGLSRAAARQHMTAARLRAKNKKK